MLAVENMAKRLVVEKAKFDAVLSQMLKAKPEPREKIKTRGQRGSKSPLIPPKPSKS